MTPRSIARMLAAASRAPEAPRQWPIIDLVELIGDVVGVFAQSDLDHPGLDLVTQRCRSSVGIDVIDFVGLYLRPLPIAAVMARAWMSPAGFGSADVVGVGAHAVAADLGVDPGAARTGPLHLLKNQDSRALAHDEAVAVAVEGTAGAFRLVVPFRKRAHGCKRCDPHRGDRGFAAAREHDVGGAALDDLESIADGVARRGAGGADGA